ncbi:MAG: AMP-binding protein [Lautropia sp.]
MIESIPESRRTLPRVAVAQAERHGAKPYIVFSHAPARPITYELFASNSENAGSCLARDYSIPPGTIGATLLPNGADFVTAWGAYLFAGMVDVPINYEYRKTLLRFALATVGARMVITDADGVERLLDPEVGDYLPELKLVVVAGQFDAGAILPRLRATGCSAPLVPMAELLRSRAPARAWEQVRADELAALRYTSGTTGPAKGIMFSHLILLNRTATHNHVMTLGQADVLYTPFPMYHGLSGMMGAIGALQAGATMCGAARFSASRFWADCRDNGATLGHILFSLLPMVLAQPESPLDTEHSVRWLYSGWPNREFETRFKTRFLQIFAQSEAGVMAFRRGGTEEGSRCVGQPIPEVEMRIVDELDHPVPAGAIGEIVIRPRAPHRLMMGYFNNLPATVRAFRNLWHHTGDAGLLDDEGRLTFLGRIGDTIRRRGVNISSDQLDEEIVRHSNVLECATIGVPSPFGEEDILACVVWREPPASRDAAVVELIEFLAARLPRQQMPRYVEIFDAFPKTDTGKIRKTALKAREAHEAVWDREAGTWLPSGAWAQAAKAP